MLEYLYADHYQESLSTSDFKRLSDFINSNIGIKMPASKIKMLESRLRKRIQDLQMDSYRDYCDYLFSPAGLKNELVSFINVITTNKTEFFREPDHFDYLFRNVLPELINKKGTSIKKRLNLWSAACSRGNEAYTIAIVLSEFLRKYPGLKFDFSIIATDICTNVVEEAERAVYPLEEIDALPAQLRKRYFLKSKDPEKKIVRIVPQLRNRVKCFRLNLMDDVFGFSEQMDIIFCRNVFIYFDKKTQDDISKKLYKNLKQKGYLFIGHSEVFSHSQELPIIPVAPSIYQKII